jgi:xanthine dehydrogenase molybdopterin-binding subunit B
MSATGIGAAVRRKEDQRFVTGKGNYTADVNRPGQSHAYFLRSPHARAKIKSIDHKAASAMPGVLAVLTGAELAADKIGGLICGWMIHSKDGSPMKMAPHPALAHGNANHVGDAVAVVIAETIAQAKDAAEKIKVDYEVLPAIPRRRRRRAPRKSTRPRRRTRSISGTSAMRRRLRPRSSRPSASPSSTSSTIVSRRTRSNHERRSATTIPAPIASRCGTPRRIRTWRVSSFRRSSAWRPSTSYE